MNRKFYVVVNKAGHYMQRAGYCWTSDILEAERYFAKQGKHAWTRAMLVWKKKRNWPGIDQLEEPDHIEEFMETLTFLNKV